MINKQLDTPNIDIELDKIPVHSFTASDGITDIYWDAINARAKIKQLISSIVLEVIGKDEPNEYDYGFAKPETNRRNELKAEQRQSLKKILGDSNE